MKAHSIQSNIYITKNPERLSVEAHQCYSSVANLYPKKLNTQKSSLRRCESASSLSRHPFNPTCQQMHGIEAKYKILEERYRQMLNEVQGRSELFLKQRLEIDKLLQTTKKEEKEIERLKEMIRINEKKSDTNQTKEPQKEHSWRKIMEVSTGESEITSETRCDRSDCLKTTVRKDRSSFKKNSSLKSLEKEKPKIVESRESRVYEGKGKERAPLMKKYKFIPTLNFKHN